MIRPLCFIKTLVSGKKLWYHSKAHLEQDISSLEMVDDDECEHDDDQNATNEQLSKNPNKSRPQTFEL